MYCDRCGTYNEETALQCIICRHTVTPGHTPQEVKIYGNLALLPYMEIIRSVAKSNPALLPLTFPIISINYFIRRLAKRPYLVHELNCRESKIHLCDIKSLSNLDRASFKKTQAFLAREGFEPFIELEDRCRPQIIVESTFINREYRAYATIVILKATGRIIAVQYFAVTAEKKIITFTNSLHWEIADDRNLLIHSIPGASAEETWEQFSTDPQRSGEKRLCPEPDFLFPILHHFFEL